MFFGGIFGGKGNAWIDSATVRTLVDGATIVWDVSLGINAAVTLGGNRTLSISNAVAGHYYTLRVIQDAVGSRTLTLPATSRVVNDGNGILPLTTAANAIDIATVYYDGTIYWWTYGPDFS